MPFEEFCRWLRHNLVKGVQLLAVNPKGPQCDVMEVFTFLTKIEADESAP